MSSINDVIKSQSDVKTALSSVGNFKSALKKPVPAGMDPITNFLQKKVGGPWDKPTPPPPAPTIAPPPVMPTADDAQILAAKRQKLFEDTQRQGRAATVLTGPGPELQQTLG